MQLRTGVSTADVNSTNVYNLKQLTSEDKSEGERLMDPRRFLAGESLVKHVITILRVSFPRLDLYLRLDFLC